MASVSVCFPAYNEEETIESVLTEAHELLSASGLDYEILVCDDGSRDRTGRIIDDVARRHPRFRILHNPGNQGIFYTFERLYREATKEYVFLNSVDRQWDTRILFEMIGQISRWDILIASRRKKPYTLARHVVSFLFNFLPWFFFRVETYDAGAVKLVKREIIESLPIVSSTPFNEAERIVRATRAGYRVSEFPVDVNPRTTGQAQGANLRLVLACAKDAVRVFFSIYFGFPAAHSAERPRSPQPR